MKKNTKFRNNGNNNANNNLSLNNKFDSVSPAGKICGTALDLIKRYNDLAKEAHSTGDYVQMEVFRQYAEHYRKIVTEINERKAAQQEYAASQAASKFSTAAESVSGEEKNMATNNEPSLQEDSCVAQNTSEHVRLKTKPKTSQHLSEEASAPKTKQKAFTVIEIHGSENEANASETSSTQKIIVPKRICTRRKVQQENPLPAETDTVNA